MYADDPYSQYMPYEQCVDDNVDDYIRTASYENNHSNYGNSPSQSKQFII
jgi:hypothetical protein